MGGFRDSFALKVRLAWCGIPARAAGNTTAERELQVEWGAG